MTAFSAHWSETLTAATTTYIPTKLHPSCRYFNAGLLAVTGLSAFDKENYEYFCQPSFRARVRSCSLLLPPPMAQLLHVKPLKPKPLTKWQLLPREKGINLNQHVEKIWDDERQAWMPANTDVGYDPSKEAQAERKECMVKNEPQRMQNPARVEQGWTMDDGDGHWPSGQP
ncbi:hypothetical protein H4582DRAFT_2066344 [Lactarius indigo]|nr:hypothetical protein H4582DRAFT_2066344 [Lactarius indigo]